MSLRSSKMGWAWRLGVAALASTLGCNDADVRFANGEIKGTVVASRPVEGAAVRVWAVRPDGTQFSAFKDGRQEDSPIAEATTAADGTFTVELGINEGEILIEAFGGTTVELVTGEQVALDPDIRLSAVIPGVIPDEHLTMVVSPLTTMAEALGDARLAHDGDGKESDYETAQVRALELIGDHFARLNLVRTSLADPTAADQNGTLSEPVRYGLMLAALSVLSNDIAEHASATSNVVNTALLTQVLAADLRSAEALFDGTTEAGSAVLGSCPRPDPCEDERCTTRCDLGPITVRGRLAQALGDFIGGSELNATGLSGGDVGELRLDIAKNAEPELFGNAPIDTEGAPLSLNADEFFVATEDGQSIHWTRDLRPLLAGHVDEDDGVRVEVSVNGSPPQLAVVTGEGWEFLLPEDGLRPAPSTNSVEIASVDVAGNRLQLDAEIRVDQTPARVTYEPSDVQDERFDTLVFEGAPGVHHDHPGAPIDLPGTADNPCPEVFKHVNEMDPTDVENPLRFRFSISDRDVGVAPDRLRVVLRDRVTKAELTGPLTPTSRIETAAGFDYELNVTRDMTAALSRDSTIEIVVEGADHLEQGETAVACWTHRPLGPPLRAVNPQKAVNGNSGNPGVIEARKLSSHHLGANFAPLLNNTPAGIASFDIENFHDEAVYFELDVTEPAMTAKKTWSRFREHWFTETLFPLVACVVHANGLDTCESNDGPMVTARQKDATVAAADFAVWDVTDPGQVVELSPCEGCGPNRFVIPPRPAGQSRSVVRVMTLADFSDLYPGPTPSSGYADQPLNHPFTGKFLGEGYKCAKSAPLDPGLCESMAHKRLFLSLDDVTVDIPEFSLTVTPAAGPNAVGRTLVSIEDRTGTVPEQQWNP